jgi:hypothetical protein
MPYIVQAEESEDHSAVSKTHEDRKEALVTAVKDLFALRQRDPIAWGG